MDMKDMTPERRCALQYGLLVNFVMHFPIEEQEDENTYAGELFGHLNDLSFDGINNENNVIDSPSPKQIKIVNDLFNEHMENPNFSSLVKAGKLH